MSTRISSYVRIESRHRWEAVRKELLAGVEAITAMASDPQADAEDREAADKEIEFLRQLLSHV